MDRGDRPHDQEIWMLRQPDEVRRSYLAAIETTPQVRWMLGQPDAVRESYITEVIEQR